MTNVTQMNETERQYYFMEKASGHVAKLGEKLGRKPTCCVTTFGCQMNARDSEKLVGIPVRSETMQISAFTEDWGY